MTEWTLAYLLVVHCAFAIPILARGGAGPYIYNRLPLPVISTFRLNQAVRLCYVEAAVANFTKQEQHKIPSDFLTKKSCLTDLIQSNRCRRTLLVDDEFNCHF